MTWNYRILDHGSHLTVHEVHYDRRGNVRGWSAEPTTFVCDPEEGADGLRIGLERALADVINRPVLNAAAETARVEARRIGGG